MAASALANPNHLESMVGKAMQPVALLSLQYRKPGKAKAVEAGWKIQCDIGGGKKGYE